jgi:hypothetical protein
MALPGSSFNLALSAAVLRRREAAGLAPGISKIYTAFVPRTSFPKMRKGGQSGRLPHADDLTRLRAHAFHPLVNPRMKGPGFPLQSFLRLLRAAKKYFRCNPLRGNYIKRCGEFFKKTR